MKPSKKQASEGAEEISLAASATDEISGVFRFLCDYRLPAAEWQSHSRSDSGSISATGASIATSRGVGAPQHTPMGSTTRLVADSAPSKGCRCGLGGVMAALSLVVSLGNIVRLPAVAYLHGGGSFLVVYTIVAIFFGIPLVFLEVLLGQFCQEGTTKLWSAVPLLKGIGFITVFSSVMTAIYYPVIIAVALFFAVWSAKGPVPIPECSYHLMSENGEACVMHTLLQPPDQDPVFFGVNIALLFSIWVLVMLCLCKYAVSYRVSSSVLLVVVVTALGAMLAEQLGINHKGLDKLMKIDFNTIFNLDTWYYAVVQLFFSTQLGFGNITTISGRIYSKRNAFWISLMYVVCNVAVGVGVTCLLFMWTARLEDQGVAIIKPQVPELFVLTFIYDVITHCFTTDVQLWAVVAFLAIFFAGLSSLLALVFTVTTSVIVESKERWRPWIVTAGFCFVAFLGGIMCLLSGKLELVHMLEHYLVSHIVVLATAIQLIGFIWIYGSHHLYTDFEFVLGYKLTSCWKFIWLITPLCIIGLQIWSLLSMPITGTREKTDPEWLYITGWCVSGSSWLMVIIVAVWQIIIQVDYNIWQKFLSSLKPSRNWGPVDPIQRHEWVVWREQCTLSGERDFTLKRRGTRDYTHSVRNAANESKRYSPQYSKHDQDEKTVINDLNRTFTINSVPNYSSTHETDVGVRGVGGPYTVQLPDHVCWRKDMIPKGRLS